MNYDFRKVFHFTRKKAVFSDLDFFKNRFLIKKSFPDRLNFSIHFIVSSKGGKVVLYMHIVIES